MQGDGTPYIEAGDGRNTIQSLLLSVQHQPGQLSKALRILNKVGVNLARIESRPNKLDKARYEIYIDLEAPLNDPKVKEAVKQLRTTGAYVIECGTTDAAITHEYEVAWFPRRIQDLDTYASKCLEYGEDLDASHPGFTDEAYRKRRKEIVKIAKNYCHGKPIPRIEYTENEISTWGKVYTKLKELYPKYACAQHQYIFPLLEENCGYGPDRIPQLQDVSDFLRDCTGWTLRPVQGLLSPRDFLNGLAFRVFHSTQYIRHHSKPFYTPEPDVCHELLGHVPLFADPEFAEFSQEIGLASLGVSDEEITKLATCYWFTVEFGLCKEGDEVKAFGAGLLSSFGELEYSCSEESKKTPFDPFVACDTEYPITQYQPLYFVADSFEDAKVKMRAYSRKGLQRPFEVWFDDRTNSVEVLNSKDALTNLTNHIQGHVTTLLQALMKLSF